MKIFAVNLKRVIISKSKFNGGGMILSMDVILENGEILSLAGTVDMITLNVIISFFKRIINT